MSFVKKRGIPWGHCPNGSKTEAKGQRVNSQHEFPYTWEVMHGDTGEWSPGQKGREDAGQSTLGHNGIGQKGRRSNGEHTRLALNTVCLGGGVKLWEWLSAPVTACRPASDHVWRWEHSLAWPSPSFHDVHVCQSLMRCILNMCNFCNNNKEPQRTDQLLFLAVGVPSPQH